jgi:hypothetical protein
VFLVNQRGVFGVGAGDPGTGIANAAGILRDGNDLEIPVS